MTTKDVVLRVLEQLPDDAEIEDVIERLYFVRKLQMRLEEEKTDEWLSSEEVFRKMEQWLK